MSETTARGGDGHTPLIRQYLEVKSRHPDSLLFFRVGDFYEMFFEDAEEGSGLLGLTLTSRNNGGSGRVPLAGVPVKAAQEYVSRLLDAGRRVAICEQLEDAAVADGIVKRDVVEIITPGTVLEDSRLAAKRNNFVVAVGGAGVTRGVAAIDLSTGEFDLAAFPAEALEDELARLEPAEVLRPDSTAALSGPWMDTARPAWRFDPELAVERLCDGFGVSRVEGFGLDPAEDRALLAAAGGLLAYLDEVRPDGLSHLRHPRVERGGHLMYLDRMTRRNLELVEPLRPGRGSTLLGLLDHTATAMGGRLLRRWILAPLLDREAVERRLDAVATLVTAERDRGELRRALAGIRDLERLAARIATGRAGPRDLLGLGASLAPLPAVHEALQGLESERLEALTQSFDLHGDVRAFIDSALEPDAPATLSDGGVIRRGYDAGLDALREERETAVDWIAGMQVRERERTGIDNLKVGFNKVFGYYLEVTRSKLDRVPGDYVRKQTLTNAERFLTPELKQWEAKVLGADDALGSLEARLFQEVRAEVGRHVGRLQETARRVAEIDVYAALAEAAVRYDYRRPELSDQPVLEIEAGRHPVVERSVGERFIPNDVALDSGRRVMIVTGPNMSGKSTVLRQVGLIALMAQAGSFVPAARARLGLSDRVFTRVGASDNLAEGQSTFMVEMTETATILNSASQRSLVLLDEIGRGTSTFDGLSIAWAVTECLHAMSVRTIFATHYHELVGLADQLETAEPFNVEVRESGSDIVFLHRLKPGGSDRSYGVQVGKLAGLPSEVVERAREILEVLENGPERVGGRTASLVEAARDQLSLWAKPAPSLVEERLRALDPERMTPLDALSLLVELREEAIAASDAGGSGRAEGAEG